MRAPPPLLTELHGLRFWNKPNFFPPRPRQEQLARLEKLVIGTKNRTLGDALILSSLPRRLKEHYPQLRVHAFVRGCTPWIFAHNPYVDGVSRAPQVLWGDDTNWGEGHLIQQKERWFGLEPISPHPKPELYLSDSELRWARADLEAQGPSPKPIIALHPAGRTAGGGGVSPEQWETLCRALKPVARVWQLTLKGGTPKLPSAERAWEFEPGGLGLRRMFAALSQAQGFIGVDSGPMHVARAFDVPALIISRLKDVAADLERADREPYFLHGNLTVGFLYRDQTHLESWRFQSDEGVEAALEWVQGL